MKLIRLQIEKLFDIFDYDIPIENKDNLLIITGPNGFGKTKILNIIYHFFRKDLSYFETLVFEKIILSFDNNHIFSIHKVQEQVYISKGGEETEKPIGKYKNIPAEMDRILENEKINFRANKDNSIQVWGEKDEYFANLSDFLDSYKSKISKSVFQELTKLNLPYVDLEKSLSEIANVHLIKEQRLFKKSTPEDYEDDFRLRLAIGDEMVETVTELAKDLKQLIDNTFNQWLELSQKLDSTFPKRLLNGATQLSEEEFKNRFTKLIEKQNLLKSYHLVETEQEVPDYDPENAKVLSIYLKDSEAKFGVFDILLQKLNLFTTILNERRFTFKSIKISKTKGFYFETIHKKPLNLTALSSGEQHEIVLLYELIFNAKENMMILIDEPEISLHVTWQKEFVSDLLKIIELQKVQVVIATHSPQIIGSRWDLVYNLEKRD